jgi:hypothetical protein
METIINEKPWFKEILKKTELQDITLRNLYEFYLNNNNIFKILPIITSNSNISIRVLDWFVTNYSKKYTIIYELNRIDINGDKYFNVFLQYKCQLKSYKKKLFDPFCRKQRIGFHYDENKCVVTTIGQLNFFRWAINYGILKYVEDNLQDITNDMINSNKLIVKKYKNTNIINKTNDLENETESNSPINSVSKTKTKTKIKTNSNSSKELSINDSTNSSESEKTRKKRQELSISANKTINIHNYSIVLTFE